MTALHEISISGQEFLRRIPPAFRTPARIARYHTDYALTRLVAANCAAIGEHADERNPTPLVVKGGFAVRHLYGSPRFSKDADLSMASDDLEMEGPSAVVWPSDMRHEAVPAEGLAGWILFVDYLDPNGARRKTQCDLNDRTRRIRDIPPRRRTLAGLFLAPFDVWSATTEEILGEKMAALVDSWRTGKNLRVKDVFDLRHVLRKDDEPVDAATVCLVYRQNRAAKRDPGFPDLPDYPRVLSEIVGSDQAAARWADDVVATVDEAPTLAQAAEELADLLARRVLVAAG